MEYRIERKVVFWEEAHIEADSLEDLKEKLKSAKLYWDIDPEYPKIENMFAYDEDDEEYELPNDIMENDSIYGGNGYLVFNEEEYDKYLRFD